MKTISALAIASAVAGALTLAAGAGAQTKDAQGFKCYGVAKAGLNDCANAAKSHDCAGQARNDYDLGEWKAVKDGAECTTLGGSTMPGKGRNSNAKM